MGASSSRETGGGLLTEINVTPLVDVVLVLLLLMMVTATSLASRTIPVELPRSNTADGATGDRPLVVGVDENGTLFLDRDRADDAAVHARARGAVARSKQTAAVIAADGRARHEAVVHALEILRSEQVAKIAIVVRAAP